MIKLGCSSFFLFFKWSLLFVMWIFPCTIHAQNTPLFSIDYTYGFETGPDTNYTRSDVKVKSISGDWQIGTPVNKTTFLAAYNRTRAAITDTSGPYSSDTLSQMIIQLKGERFGLGLSFWYKLDMEDGSDSAKIDFSFDNGLTWLDSVSTAGFLLCKGDYFYGINLFGTLKKSQPNWTRAVFSFKTGYLVRLDDCSSDATTYPDSALARFSFYSNTSHPQKDGWMIDDVAIGSFLVGGLSDYDYFASTTIQLEPNPSSDQTIHIHSLQSGTNIQGYEVEDLNGIRKGSFKNSSVIDVSTLPAGMYVVKIETSKGMAVKKMLVH